MPVEFRQRLFQDFLDKDFGVRAGGRKVANKIVPRGLQIFREAQSGWRLFVIRVIYGDSDGVGFVLTQRREDAG